jgi:hypothetical protein
MFTLSERTNNIIRLTLSLFAVLAIFKLIFFKQELSIESLFKIYFISTSIFFIYRDFKRYSMAEFISTIGIVSGIFSLLSFKSELIVFSSFVLIIVSFFTFMITRFRPDKGVISFVYLSLILCLLYRVSPFVSLIGILSILLMFLFKSKDNSIDSLIINFLLPIIFYLMLLDLADLGSKITLNTSIIRVISLVTMTLVSVFFISKSFYKKESCSYSVYYLSHILLAFSINTISSIIIGLTMLFIFPFIYSSKVSRFSLFNMAMLPPSPIFILKIGLLAIILRTGHIGDYLIVSLSYIIVIFHTFRFFYISNSKNKTSSMNFQKILVSVSFLVILVCLIYLNTIKNIIGSALINVIG